MPNRERLRRKQSLPKQASRPARSKGFTYRPRDPEARRLSELERFRHRVLLPALLEEIQQGRDSVTCLFASMLVRHLAEIAPDRDSSDDLIERLEGRLLWARMR